MEWDLIILAPAKINWFLHIHSKREDGYHEITSLIQTVTLFDEIYLKKDKMITVETEPFVIEMKDNIVYKAIKNLQRETGIDYGVRIRIRKNIPLMAGLGGGSSDALFTLRGLDVLWNLDMKEEILSKIARDTGSDVASFINPPSIISGRGEITEHVDIERTWTLLLVKPLFGISSRWAYEEYDRLSRDYTKKEDLSEIIDSINRGDFHKLKNISRNDLEIPVFNYHPLLREICNTMMDNGALFTRMSGSGSTVYGVFHEKKDACKIAEIFSYQEMWTMVVDTINSRYNIPLSL